MGYTRARQMIQKDLKRIAEFAYREGEHDLSAELEAMRHRYLSDWHPKRGKATVDPQQQAIPGTTWKAP